MLRQLVDVPFAAGPNQKVDQRWIEVGREYSVTNGIWLKQNTIAKPPGFTGRSRTELTGAGGLTKVSKLYKYRAETGIMDGQYMRAYVSQANAWTVRDEISPCVATRETISQFGTNVYNADVAETAGYRMFVWTDATSAAALYFTLIEVATGAVIGTGWVGNTSESVTSPRVFAIGAKFYLVYQRTTNANIVVRTFDTAALSSGWSGLTVLTTAARANSAMDVVATTGNASYVLVFEATAGPPYLNLFRFDATNAITASRSVTGENNQNFVATTLRADAVGGVLWLVYSYASGQIVNGATYNPTTLTQIAAPFNIQPNTATAWGYYLGVERLDSTHAMVVMGTNTKFQWCSIDSSGASVIGFKTGSGLQPLSRPFAVNSLDSVYGVRTYMLCAYAQTTQSTQFVVELDSRTNAAGLQAPHPVATIAPRFSYTGLGTSIRSAGPGTSVTNLGAPSSTSYVMAGTIAESQAVHGRTALVAVTLDFAHPGLYTSAELGESLYIACGVPCSYDGTNVWECGSLTAVDMASFGAAVNIAVGGSLAQPQTYSWIFVPEWHDARGQRRQGQPSLPISGVATSAGNQKFNITVPLPSLTLSGEADMNLNIVQGYLVPYRTCVTGGVMSTVYYRTIGDVPTGGWVLQFPALGSGAATYADDGTGTFADATASQAESLYTTNNVLESDGPPSFTTLCTHKNRIYGVGDDQRTVWVSTEYVPGQTVRFNDGLTFTVEDIGNIVAIWSMDDKLFVASKGRIVYYTGSGPNELGSGNDLTGPFRLATDVGCIDPRSVVVTPMGTMFQSRIGIALLDRGLSVNSSIGDNVEDTLAANSVITSATLHPTRPEVWFTCVPSPGTTITTGASLIYNYRFNAWSTRLHYDSVAARASAGMCSSVSANGAFVIAAPNGAVYAENANPAAVAGSLDPGSTWITTTVETAWIKPAGLQGFGRLWRALFAGTWLDFADLTISVATDYASAYGQSALYTSLNNAGATTGDAAQLEMRLPAPRGEAFRFRVSDAVPSDWVASSGQGFTLVGLTAEVGVMSRANRSVPSRRK